MRRATTLVCLAVLAMLASVRPARADFWDWLQEFSGPGPFGTGSTLNTTFSCPEKVKVATRDLAFKPEDPITCFFFDHRSFDNTHQPENFGVTPANPEGVGKVSLHFYEGGFSRRVHPAIEVGFGGGVMSIASKGQTSYKVVLTTPRVLITPAMLFGRPSIWNENPNRWKHLARIVKFYGRINIVGGKLTAEDFGLTPDQSDFETSWERVASAGFIFDADEVYRLITNK